MLLRCPSSPHTAQITGLVSPLLEILEKKFSRQVHLIMLIFSKQVVLLLYLIGLPGDDHNEGACDESFNECEFND